jgi:hypothetical protein
MLMIVLDCTKNISQLETPQTSSTSHAIDFEDYIRKEKSSKQPMGMGRNP